jgi:hypothetical protein
VSDASDDVVPWLELDDEELILVDEPSYSAGRESESAP